MIGPVDDTQAARVAAYAGTCHAYSRSLYVYLWHRFRERTNHGHGPATYAFAQDAAACGVPAYDSRAIEGAWLDMLGLSRN